MTSCGAGADSGPRSTSAAERLAAAEGELARLTAHEASQWAPALGRCLDFLRLAADLGPRGAPAKHDASAAGPSNTDYVLTSMQLHGLIVVCASRSQAWPRWRWPSRARSPSSRSRRRRSGRACRCAAGAGAGSSTIDHREREALAEPERLTVERVG
jgi:hypothetical protein